MDSRLAVAVVAGLGLLVAGCATDPAAPAERLAATSPASRVEPCEAQGPMAAVPGSAGLPDGQLPCLVGSTTVRLSDLRERPTVVNLWASWCVPCRREMPALRAAHDRWGADVRFLGVNVRDDRRAALTFLADFGVTYPQVVDVEGRLPSQLGSPGLPVTVVVDADGAVVWRRVGELNPDELQRAVERAATGRGAQASGSGQ